jgi:AraC-like DNA-binding protein
MISHLHQEPTLKDLSLFLGYSEKYCSQLFHTVIGQSFRFYLKTLRVERAKLLLQEGHVSLIEIATALGFSDQFAFSHFFKNAVGSSPTYFRTFYQDLSEVQPTQNPTEHQTL